MERRNTEMENREIFLMRGMCAPRERPLSGAREDIPCVCAYACVCICTCVHVCELGGMHRA